MIFLGNVISSEGMAPDPSRIKAMKEFPAPKDVKTLRQLLGLTNYYRRYCRGYSHIIQPLLKLLRKNTPFVWDEECQAAFKRLIEAMTTAPILRLPVMGQKFYLLTDASTKAIGYILAQKNEDNILTPVGYGGRSIRRGGEQNYTVTELELLAILEGIRRFSSFLSNVEFEVISDHVALSYIESLKAHHGRLGRWAVFLQGYNFKVTHIAGHKHLGPDLLSRREYPEESKDDADTEFENMLLNLNEALAEAVPPRVRPKQSIELRFEYEGADTVAPIEGEDKEESIAIEHDLTDIGALQRVCPDSRDMIIFLEKGILPADDQKARKIAITSENYEMIDGKLFFISRPRNQKIAKLKPVVRLLQIPRSLRGEIVESYHSENGHLGLEKLFATITEKYHWQGMWNDLLEVTKSCISCQTAKKTTKPKFAPMHVIPPGNLDTIKMAHGHSGSFALGKGREQVHPPSRG